MHERNEVGEAVPRGRATVPSAEAELDISTHFGKPVKLPEGAVVTSGPSTCAACGAATVEWAATAVKLDRDEIHPILWHESAALADSFICTSCDAGWYEPDDPEPFQWVRPYWIIS